MKQIKIFGLVVVAAAICSLLYYFMNPTKQQSSTTVDSTTVKCDSICIDSNSKACCNSAKVDSISK